MTDENTTEETELLVQPEPTIELPDSVIEPVSKPKNNTTEIVVVILLIAVIMGFMIWYNYKNKEA